MTVIHKIVVGLLLLICSPMTVSGQLNIFSGFATDFFYQKPLTSLVTDYNDKRTWLSDPLEEFNSILGVEVGLRYRYDVVGFMTGIKIGSRKRKAAGTSPLLGTVEEKINLGRNTIFLGTEIFLDPAPISIGASLGYDILKVKHTPPKANSDQTIINTNNWNTQFFLSMNFGGNTTTKLSIRPFWNVAWQKNNFSPLFSAVQSEITPSQFKLNSFGISLILFNGP